MLFCDYCMSTINSGINSFQLEHMVYTPIRASVLHKLYKINLLNYHYLVKEGKKQNFYSLEILYKNLHRYNEGYYDLIYFINL